MVTKKTIFEQSMLDAVAMGDVTVPELIEMLTRTAYAEVEVYTQGATEEETAEDDFLNTVLEAIGHLESASRTYETAALFANPVKVEGV